MLELDGAEFWKFVMPVRRHDSLSELGIWGSLRHLQARHLTEVAEILTLCQNAGRIFRCAALKLPFRFVSRMGG